MKKYLMAFFIGALFVVSNFAYALESDIRLVCLCNKKEKKHVKAAKSFKKAFQEICRLSNMKVASSMCYSEKQLFSVREKTPVPLFIYRSSSKPIPNNEKERWVHMLYVKRGGLLTVLIDDRSKGKLPAIKSEEWKNTQALRSLNKALGYITISSIKKPIAALFIDRLKRGAMRWEEVSQGMNASANSFLSHHDSFEEKIVKTEGLPAYPVYRPEERIAK